MNGDKNANLPHDLVQALLCFEDGQGDCVFKRSRPLINTQFSE